MDTDILILVLMLAVAALVAARNGRAPSTGEDRWLAERVLDAHEREREMWARERQMLLNRIKPETAQIVALDVAAPTPPTVGFDDDEAHWAARGVSREELAMAYAEQELASRGVEV